MMRSKNFVKKGRPNEENEYSFVNGIVLIDVSTKRFPDRYAVIDEEDFHKVIDGRGKWFAIKGSNTLYACRKQKEKMHIAVMGEKNGFVVDHIDWNGLNNRRSNLRHASCSQNQGNAPKRRKGTSRFKGVSWYTSANKWGANIMGTKNGKRRYLGLFVSDIEAAKAYDQAAKELFGPFAVLNFPDAE